MNLPNYRFRGWRENAATQASDAVVTLSPIYGDNLAVTHSLQSGERYYLPALDGTMLFLRDDYEWIMSSHFGRFNTIYHLEAQCLLKGSVQWTTFCEMRFVITDCAIDENDRIVEVSPTIVTPYDPLLDGMDREFNLVDLKPAIANLTWYKRAILQVTTNYSQTVTNCIGVNTWEEERTDTSQLSDTQMTNDYKFGICDVIQIATLSDSGAGDYFAKVSAGDTDYELLPGQAWTSSPYSYKLRFYESGGSYYLELYRKTLGSSYTLYASARESGHIPQTLTNEPLLDVDTSQVRAYLTLKTVKVYARILCDVSYIGQTATESRPTSDIVEYNANYKYVSPYTASLADVTNRRQTDPTEWGYFTGSVVTGYYLPPDDTDYYLPMLQSDWTGSGISLWMNFSNVPGDSNARKAMTLRHAYPLASCIKVLLGEIAPDILFDEQSAYSEFLFGSPNPLVNWEIGRLFMTPKTNIINGDYKTPAYKATVTLKAILEMLRNTFQCYWYIDGSNRLRIEHVSWFMNGGSYLSAHVISHNLTQVYNARNARAWAFAQMRYTFAKSEMPATRTFAWMDDVTAPFNGYEMRYTSPLVDKSRNEQTNVGMFTTDIDYVTLEPGDISKDGFMLLGGVSDGKNGYMTTFWSWVKEGTTVTTPLQNGYLAFAYMEKTNIWLANAPQGSVDYGDGATGQIWMQSRDMEQNSVRFPMASPAVSDLLPQLIRTHLGDGEITTIKINLSSLQGEATLRYDTQQQS